MRDVALLVCRPVPVLAEASVVAAGTLRVPFARFAVVVAAANVAISAWYASLGATAVNTRTFVVAFLVAALLPGLALLGRRWFVRGTAGHR
jgi:membrane protein DedA with SNARE-associated domain